MSELIRKNASELVELLKSGQVSSVELTKAHLDRSAAVDQDVHSYLHQNPETALAAAADIDRRRAAGEQLHELAGAGVDRRFGAAIGHRVVTRPGADDVSATTGGVGNDQGDGLARISLRGCCQAPLTGQ